MKVLTNDGAGALVVEPLLNVDVDFTADGAATNDFARVVKTAAGSPSRRVRAFELTWTPDCLSIFKVQEALPAGKFELTMDPQTANSYKQRAIESLVTKTPGLTNDYDFKIVDMYLYVATVESTRIDDISYYLSLDETRCQVKDTFTAGTLTQKHFDVSPSTYALTVALQDEAAGTLTHISASKFKVRNDVERNLSRMFINYAGQSKPSPDSDASYDAAAARDNTTQRYLDSILQSGQYFRDGGSESLKEWQERGQMYHFAFPRDGRDRSTRVQVNAQIQTSAANTRLLCFDHYKSIAHISVKDGRVVDVNLMEA